jgi:hypothetical protein
MTIENTPQPAPETPTQQGFSILALVSTLTGALSYFLILFAKLIHLNYILALILAPISALIAIITGHSSHRQIKLSEGTLGGKKLSRAGLIMGYLYFALGILAIVLIILITGNLIHSISGLFS